MKSLSQFITEKQNFLINSKINSAVKSSKSNKILYIPKSWNELYEAIKNLLDKGETNLNCIDTSNITDMSYLFKELNKRYEITEIDVSEWDVSKVENMYCMFQYCDKFYGNELNNWNTSRVKNMESMFEGCHSFNCNLSNWDVTKVNDMTEMFKDCKNFEGKGLENWNINNFKYMKRMFDGCHKLKNIPSWYKG